jgi:hypothetical protein
MYLCIIAHRINSFIDKNTLLIYVFYISIYPVFLIYYFNGYLIEVLWLKSSNCLSTK